MIHFETSFNIFTLIYTY
jgi:hypothetical protein